MVNVVGDMKESLTRRVAKVVLAKYYDQDKQTNLTYIVTLLVNATQTMSLTLACLTWTLSRVPKDNDDIDNSKYVNIPVSTIPTSVHMDLLRKGLIDDPYESFNELKQTWISESDWIYEATMKKTLLTKKRKHYLVFQGLDTLCTVTLNGKIILESNNMFIRHIIDIADHVNDDTLTIRLFFHSALQFCRQASEKAPYPIPCPQYTQCFSTKGRNYLRKMGCDFGWDWGPAFIPTGPNGSIDLLSCDGSYIEDVIVNQTNHLFQDQTCTSVDIEIKTFLSGKGDEIDYKIIDLTQKDAIVFHEKIIADTNMPIVKTRIQNPNLWWPNGYGDQSLYKVQVSVVRHGIEEQSSYLDREIQIGIRDLVLDMSPDEIGNKFTFIVNKVPIYAKGSNWIPSDCFSTRITYQHLNTLLKSARDTHQNMMRVWGGGSYEKTEFYELCDKYGILLWHDMMFACSLYPSNPSFLSSVRIEIQQQIRRIQHHACIALYAGNNENEEALHGWPDAQDPNHKQKYVIDYYKLYYDTIYDVIQTEDPSRPYLPSSPTNGLNEWGNPQDLTRGDAHYWAVWHQNKPFSTYRTVTPRFSSEFGFQSIPSVETLQPYVNGDLNITSPSIEFRQRSYMVGNKCILEHMTREFRLPKDFLSTVYLSQVNQALAIKTACEHWRRQKAVCSGALYWQVILIFHTSNVLVKRYLARYELE
jgi:beta-mannosidase